MIEVTGFHEKGAVSGGDGTDDACTLLCGCSCTCSCISTPSVCTRASIDSAYVNAGAWVAAFILFP
jgi:hypothetical protein